MHICLYTHSYVKDRKRERLFSRNWIVGCHNRGNGLASQKSVGQAGQQTWNCWTGNDTTILKQNFFILMETLILILRLPTD